MHGKIVAEQSFCEPELALKTRSLKTGVPYKAAICLPRGKVISLGAGYEMLLQGEGDNEFLEELVGVCKGKCHKQFPSNKKDEMDAIKSFVLVCLFRIKEDPVDHQLDTGLALQPPLYKNQSGEYDYLKFRNAVIKSARVLSSFLNGLGIALHDVHLQVDGMHGLQGKKGSNALVSRWIRWLTDETGAPQTLLAYANLKIKK